MSPSRRDFLISSTAAAFTSSRILGANDRVQVGFIGYGLMGAQHVETFKRQPDVDLAAVCDVYEPRLAQGLAACGPGAKGYADFRRLLDAKEIQTVVVATPDHWHAPLSLLACAAGKDVYVEKPLSLFVREGRWLVNSARRYGRIVQAGSQQRSGLHYARAAQLVASGHIGKVHTARLGAFRNLMPGFGTPPDSAPPPGLDYDLWLGPAPARPYNPLRSLYHFRWFWDYSGGQMTNLGAHELDVVHWFMGTQAPQAVASSGGRSKTAARLPTRRTRSSSTPDSQRCGRTAKRAWAAGAARGRNSSAPREASRSRVTGSKSFPTFAARRKIRSRNSEGNRRAARSAIRRCPPPPGRKR
jgi:predicted dehydrogenase